MSEHDKKEDNSNSGDKKYDYPKLISIAKETTDLIKKQEKIKLTKDSIVLDFGAGTGLIGLNFVYEVKQVIFLDLSKPMLDYLEKKCQKQGIKNYAIFNGIIEDYNPKEKVDLITVGMVLHHIENLQSIFSKFLEILKPKGFVCITEYVKNAPMFDIEEHGQRHKLPHRGFNAKELCKVLIKIGFINTEIKGVSSINYKGDDGKDIISERYMIIAQGP